MGKSLVSCFFLRHSVVLMCSIGLRLRNSTFWVLIGWVSFQNVESPTAETINSDVVLGENKTREGMATKVGFLVLGFRFLKNQNLEKSKL